MERKSKRDEDPMLRTTAPLMTMRATLRMRKRKVAAVQALAFARAALQSAPLPHLSFTAFYYQLGKPQASATKGIIRRSKNISLRV
jgi:hypothetical protein